VTEITGNAGSPSWIFPRGRNTIGRENACSGNVAGTGSPPGIRPEKISGGGRVIRIFIRFIFEGELKDVS
jgi:hypothetical protein